MKEKEARDQIVGAWNLTVYQIRDPDGKVLEEKDFIGQLMYSEDGHMSVFFMSPKRTPFTEDGEERSFEELKSVFEEFGGYFGTYDIDAETGTITHHLMGVHVPSWVGMDFKRWYRFERDRLELRTKTRRLKDKEIYQYLVWERFK